VNLVSKLIDLLHRCESGHESRFPQCPICGVKWYGDGQLIYQSTEPYGPGVPVDGSKQPHALDCELGIVLDPIWLTANQTTVNQTTFFALEARVEELESMLEDAAAMHPLHCDCDACKFASARGMTKQS
jgi:hypothetical protein